MKRIEKIQEGIATHFMCVHREPSIVVVSSLAMGELLDNFEAQTGVSVSRNSRHEIHGVQIIESPQLKDDEIKTCI